MFTTLFGSHTTVHARGHTLVSIVFVLLALLPALVSTSSAATQPADEPVMSSMAAATRQETVSQTAATGLIAFETFREGNWDIYTVQPDGTKLTRLTTSYGLDQQPAWSPDGTRIAFASNRGGNWDIYVMQADGSYQTRLTTSMWSDSAPTWSPDGKLIAFRSNRDGGYEGEIYVMQADGSQQQRLTNSAADDDMPAWSPDGTRIAFCSLVSNDFNRDIYVMQADGSNPQRLTTAPGDDCHPAWSPDGTRLAFHSFRTDDNNTYNIYTMNADGTNQTQVTTETSFNMDPAWSPDGTQIVFLSTYFPEEAGAAAADNEPPTDEAALQAGGPGATDLFRINADGSGLTRVTNDTMLDFSPDWTAGENTPAFLYPPRNLTARAGLGEVLLSWDPALARASLRVTGYHVYRQTDGANTFTRLTTTPIPDLSYRDAQVEDGTRYAYYVTAISNTGEESAPSNTVQVVANQLRLIIPDVRARPGTTVAVPVTIENADGLCIEAMSIGIQYDPTIATVESVENTALTYDYAFRQSNRGTEDSVYITLVGPCHELRGPGALIQVQFAVQPQAAVDSSLDFIRGLDNTSLYAEGNLDTPVDLVLVDGQLTISNEGRFVQGDLNGDSVVNAADVAIALKIAAGILTPSSDQRAAGDVNGDQVINAADAAIIFYYAANQAWPPVDAPTMLQGDHSSPARLLQLTPGNVTGRIGSEVAVPLRLNDSTAVAGSTIVVRHGDGLTYHSTHLDDTLRGTFSVETYTPIPGEVRLSLAGAEELVAGEQTLAWLTFTIDGGATDATAWIEVTGVWLNDQTGRDFTLSTLNRTIAGGTGGVTVQPLPVFLPLVHGG